MKKGFEITVKKADVYHKKYMSISRLDYFAAERGAHDRARECLAYIKNRRVPYVVKMSIYAPSVNRGKSFLEDDFIPSMIQSDVIVFANMEQKKIYEANNVIIYTKHD